MSIEIRELNIHAEIISSEKTNEQDQYEEIEKRIFNRVMQELNNIKRSRIVSGNER